MNVTEQLADFVASVRFQDLPDEAVERARLLLIDSIGVSLAGTLSPVGEIAIALGRKSRDGAATTVIGADYTTSAPSAAFINGTLAHALDMDDTAAGTVAHPSAPVVPALLALAESERLCGEEFLTAYIVGLEVFYRIALASEGRMGGWHRTALFGALAAGTASARLLGLSREQIRTALGISASFAGGVQMSFGTMTKAVQVGNASRTGVIASQWAREDCTASTDVFDDPNGFGQTFYSGHFDAGKVIANLGDPYCIVSPGIGVKIHPCCGLTHTPADIVLDLVRAHNIEADQVDEVVVYGELLWADVLVYHRPETGFQGKYSLEYVVASALIDRQLTPDTFTDVKVNRENVQANLSKVRFEARADNEWRSLNMHARNHPAEVIIRMSDGSVHSAIAPCARGYPDLPLSSRELLEKFRRCAVPALPADTAERVIERILSLETEPDLSQLVRLMRRRPESSRT